MASVNWMKMTVQKAGAMKVHLGKKERVEVKHSNTDIHPELSHLNLYIGCNDYQDAYKDMRNRVSEVDKLYPPMRIKKDRVICEMLEVPCPQTVVALGNAAVKSFFENVHEIYIKFFGAENVHGSFVHMDEIHEYIDKNGKQIMSLPHMHSLVSAYAEWTEKDKKTGMIRERKGINGKNFEKRPKYNALNDMIQEMCMQKFKVNFLTGETPQNKSVERLKMESELRQETFNLQLEISQLRQHCSELQEQEAEIRKNYLEANEKMLEAEIKQQQALENTKVAEKRAERAEERLQEANQKFDVTAIEFEKLLNKKAKASEIKLSIFDRETQTYHKNMLENTRAIGTDAYNDLMEAKSTLQEAVQIKMRAEKKEAAINPLYQKAKELYQQAEKEKQKQASITKEIENLINTKAKELLQKELNKIFSGIPTDREHRLEEFCDELKMKDGRSVLEAFEEYEDDLLKQMRSYREL